MTAYGVRSVPGPREDAEATDGLPTIRPGLDPVPTRCPQPRCGSTFLGYEEPLGPHQRGMLWCQTCSRSIAWLAAPLARPAAAAPVASRTPETSRHLRAARPLASTRFDRGPGCGPACSRLFGHEPMAHEQYGWQVARAAARAAADARVVRTGPLLIDAAAGVITLDGRELPLTATEHRMVSYLASRLDAVCPHAEVVDAVWGDGEWQRWLLVPTRYPHGTWHRLAVHCTRLRRKLGQAASLLETIPARGFRLRAEPPTAEET